MVRAFVDNLAHVRPAAMAAGTRRAVGAHRSAMKDVAAVSHEPVCGCDGEEYGNACEAARAGVGARSYHGCDSCMPACTGMPPDDGTWAACGANYDEAACTSFETGAFPASCEWVTPTSGACLVP